MQSITSQYISSAAFLVTAKIIQRTIGLISLLILARVLTPSDFAVVAIVSMVIYFFDILSSAGSEQYIVHKSDLVNEELNTAWTIDIIIKGGLSFLLILLAPVIANFYNNQDLASIFYVSSLILPINALQNPVLYLLRRQLNYSLIFKLSLLQKLFSFIATMIFVSIIPSYWAIIVGDLVASLTFTLGSYLLNNYRPTFSLKYLKNQWQFSQWMLGKSIVGYLRSQVDTFLVSRFFDANTLGRFYVSRDIVMLPGQNLILPAIQPLLAVFSKDSSKPHLLARQLDKSLIFITSITLPIVLYIWHFSHYIIATLLGEQWGNSDLLMQYLSLLVLYIPYILLLEQILIAKGKIHLALYFDILSLVIIIGGLLLIPKHQVELFALYRGILGIGCTLLLILYIRIQTPFSVTLLILWTIICFALTSLSALLANVILLNVLNLPFIKLLVSGSVYLLVYFGTISIVIITLSPYINILNETKQSMFLVFQNTRLKLLKMRNKSEFRNT